VTHNADIYDVAVVGAGVFGAWTAYELRKTGLRVVLIDAYGPGNDRSSSGDRSRIIRMGYGDDEVYTRWAARALRLWQEFSDLVGEALFQRTGVLWLVHDDDPYPEKCAATLTRAGIEFARLTRAELMIRFPQFMLDSISWAMLEPNSGALFAGRGVQAVVREAVKSGVLYREHRICPPSRGTKLDFIISESGERIAAGSYVFACGPWLPKIFPELLGDRIHPTRQEVYYFDAGSNREQYSSPHLPIWITFKDEAYGFPDLEERGVKVAIDRHGPPFDPDTGERGTTESGLREVRSLLARRLPGLQNAPVIESRVCQYENTWNGDFLIDRHPDFDNVWLVGGGSGHGFKHGPVVGEYVARWVTGTEVAAEPRFSLAEKRGGRNRAVF
jgi:monomeric sarcosine oxidase